VLARGEQLYSAFCSACHGTTGLGDAPVTKRGVPPPPSFLLENALELEDARMFRIITGGQVNMSSYAAQIDRDDRWKVVRYIRKLQGR